MFRTALVVKDICLKRVHNAKRHVVKVIFTTLADYKEVTICEGTLVVLLDRFILQLSFIICASKASFLNSVILNGNTAIIESI